MNALPATKLSMLDLVAVREGGTVAEALAIARRTAQHVETLGFTRYWPNITISLASPVR